jgi:hypothetical protein
MPKLPADSFDSLPKGSTRTGAHRGPRRAGRGWIVLAWAALVTGLLVGAGVIGLFIINDRIQFTDLIGGGTSAAPTETPTPTPTITPIVDAALSVTVLNGTATAGLAADVGQAMRDDGWAGVASMANASTSSFPSTTVYYLDATSEAAATGLANSLFAKAQSDAAANGITLGATAFRIELSPQFPGAALTAVLGTDFLSETSTSTATPAQ